MDRWPHSPIHIFNEKGTYMVTGATLHKENLFREKSDLDHLQDLLLDLSTVYKWSLEAWAIFPNHYHFVAQSPDNPESLRKFIAHFHSASARYINLQQNAPGRKVWFQYWDSRITYQNSYLARLNYVMQNPVKHKIVEHASLYKWCSVNWFENTASKSHYQTVMNFKTNDVNVLDNF